MLRESKQALKEFAIGKAVFPYQRTLPFPRSLGGREPQPAVDMLLNRKAAHRIDEKRQYAPFLNGAGKLFLGMYDEITRKIPHDYHSFRIESFTGIFYHIFCGKTREEKIYFQPKYHTQDLVSVSTSSLRVWLWVRRSTRS